MALNSLHKKVLITLSVIIVSSSIRAQINLFVGGSLQGSMNWLRGTGHTTEAGFGGGLTFVYWEYEYWFLKAGLDYHLKSSAIQDYPVDYNVPIISPDDQVEITYREHSIGLPLTVYFLPLESGGNALLLAGTLRTMYVPRLKEKTEEYGDAMLKGTAIRNRFKTGVGIGVGYQRELDKNMFLNVVPSYQLDLRSNRAYSSVCLTVEYIFGVY